MALLALRARLGCGTATSVAKVLGGGFGRTTTAAGGGLGNTGRRCFSSSAPTTMTKASIVAALGLLVGGVLSHTTACYVAVTSAIRIDDKFDKLQAALDQFETDQTKKPRGSQ